MSECSRAKRRRERPERKQPRTPEEHRAYMETMAKWAREIWLRMGYRHR